MKLITIMGALLLVPVSGSAQTLPRKGAAAKPRRLIIRAPFPCGAMLRVSCGYGPRAGSRAHRRIRASHSTNDHYALDITRIDVAFNGYKHPIVAVAPGLVRVAGWARGGWSPYGKVVYIEHDYRDRQGKRYFTLYAHLHATRVRRGQRVKAGQTIGTLGGSSRRRYLRYGPHLHFAMYRGARRWMGGGQAVVPEPMGQHQDFRRGMKMEACGEADPRLVMLDEAASVPASGGLIDSPAHVRPRVLVPQGGPVELTLPNNFHTR